MNHKNTDILIVDDEQGYRDLFTFMLEPLGMNVTCVCNGFQALEKLNAKVYDLVLLDVHMPKMNGIETLKRIKRMWPEQKVIIFSSSSDPEYKVEKQAEMQGAAECLFKPVDDIEIQRVLKKALGGVTSNAFKKPNDRKDLSYGE